MHKIQVGNDTLWAEQGERLSEVLIRNGIKVERPCGGRGTCGKCRVLVDGKEELSCQYEIHGDISVELIENGEILSQTGAQESGRITEHSCYVLDIGTTTLALALVSLDEHKVIQVKTATNPQRIYGADVITRIEACGKHGVSVLQKLLIEELNRLIADYGTEKVPGMYVAGNTTMLHIFYGVDPTSMGVAPYRPSFVEQRQIKGTELGVEGVEEIISLPSVSAFVGADLVAGIYHVGMPKQDKYSLLVDLGTNAELMLFSEEKILCTAAAAGPCFEGANISCGMSATEGAVAAFTLDEHGCSQIQTIGNAIPKGICGTGLIDIVAELSHAGIIDETGYMEDGDYQIAEGVILSQGDVRQFQLAKSAVYSAILTLMNIENVSFSQIENLYISGGFSGEMNVENATKVGLLPRELMDRCVPIHNSSLLGTVKYACEGDDLSSYVAKAHYVDLATNSLFTELFIENMEFEG